MTVTDTAPNHEARTVAVDRDALEQLRQALWSVDLLHGDRSAARVADAHRDLVDAARAVVDGKP